MPVIPQTPEENKFGNEAVEKGMRSDTWAWEEITRDEATRMMREWYGIA